MQTLNSRKSFLLFTFIHCLLSGTFLPAQNLIRGRVFDQSSTEGIPGVLIRVPGEESGTISDQQGAFEISFAPEIEIYALGYEQQIIKITAENPFLNIGLKPSPIDLQEILVTSFSSEKRLLDQAGALAILPERDLRRDNNAIITPALNRVPGVYMHSGTFNTNRITIRGIGSRSLFSTNKVRAYLNDIPLTTGEGETTIEDIDLSLIDRVEVIKGPASSIYGAGLGGTINLITKRADYRQTELTQSNLFGSYGLFRNTSSFRTSEENYNLNLIYNTQLSDGYRDNNEYDRHSFTALGQFFAGEKNQINVLANFVSLKAFIPSSIDSATFATDPRAAAFTWAQAQGFEDYERLILGISHQYLLNQQWEFSNSIFSNFRNSLEPRPFNILREGNQTLGLRSYVKFSPTMNQAEGQLILGGEYFREFYNARTFENDDRQEGAGLSDQEQLRTYFNIFFQSDWKIWAKLNLSLGFNLNQT
ncbi:MAG: TonB-dependent receptor, partial [Bacteroidota bacterium]